MTNRNNEANQANLSLSQEKELKVKAHVMQQNRALLPLHQLMFSVLWLFMFSFSHSFGGVFFPLFRHPFLLQYRKDPNPAKELTQRSLMHFQFSS